MSLYYRCEVIVLGKWIYRYIWGVKFIGDIEKDWSKYIHQEKLEHFVVFSKESLCNKNIEIIFVQDLYFQYLNYYAYFSYDLIKSNFNVFYWNQNDTSFAYYSAFKGIQSNWIYLKKHCYIHVGLQFWNKND